VEPGRPGLRSVDSDPVSRVIEPRNEVVVEKAHAVPKAEGSTDGPQWRGSEAHRGRRAGRVGTGDPPGTWETLTSPLEKNRMREGPSLQRKRPRAAVSTGERAQQRYRQAKVTKRGGTGVRESEPLNGTDEAGEPTRGTRWRDERGRVGGTAWKKHRNGDIELQGHRARDGCQRNPADSRNRGRDVESVAPRSRDSKSRMR